MRHVCGNTEVPSKSIVGVWIARTAAAADGAGGVGHGIV